MEKDQSVCKKCGAPIKWVKTKNNRSMPVDIGRKVLVTDAGSVVRGFNPHWATCPHADDFRKADRKSYVPLTHHQINQRKVFKNGK